MHWEGKEIWTNSECNNGPYSVSHKNLISEQTSKAELFAVAEAIIRKTTMARVATNIGSPEVKAIWYPWQIHFFFTIYYT
jgi:hypothetical protein